MGVWEDNDGETSGLWLNWAMTPVHGAETSLLLLEHSGLLRPEGTRINR